MGYYINPPSGTKEEWLKANAHPCPLHHVIDAKFGTWKHGLDEAPLLPVCLVDNGAFIAAGVCYDAEELAAFAHPDGRHKKWYLAKISDLIEVGALPESFKHKGET